MSASDGIVAIAFIAACLNLLTALAKYFEEDLTDFSKKTLY
jgi:hypothetical protein